MADTKSGFVRNSTLYRLHWVCQIDLRGKVSEYRVSGLFARVYSRRRLGEWRPMGQGWRKVCHSGSLSAQMGSEIEDTDDPQAFEMSIRAL